MTVLNPSFSSTASSPTENQLLMCSFFKFWFNTDAWFSIVLKSSSPLNTFFFSLPSMVYLEDFFFFFFSGFICSLIHWFFQGSLNIPVGCLPRLCDKMATATWESLEVSVAASGSKFEKMSEVPSSFTFLSFPLSFFFGPDLFYLAIDYMISNSAKLLSICPCSSCVEKQSGMNLDPTGMTSWESQ